MKLVLLFAPALLLAQSDWVVPPELRAAGYTKTRREQGVLLAGPGPNGAMTTAIAAAPYRGVPVRLRAKVRVVGEGTAQLLLRVDRPSGELGFFDDMGDRPIRAGEWNTHELYGEVASDALSIEFGVLSSGKAEVWVAEASFERLPPLSAEAAAARDALSRQYARVDGAYAEGTLDAIAALALPDAQVVIAGARTPLATILDRIRGTKLRSRSTITAIRLDGDEAAVWVNNESSATVSGVLSSNRDTWIRTATGWKLKQSTLIATRSLTPPEVLAEIPSRAGMPDWSDVRIVVSDPGAPPVPGFAVVNVSPSPSLAIDYLKEHAPEEAGPAALAFQTGDPSRLAAAVKAFDAHRAATAGWMFARQAAVFAYQSLTSSRAEALAANVIWLASEPYRSGKIQVYLPEAATVAPLVRNRYGRQVYAIGVVARELLGGDYFLDIAGVARDSAVGRWLAGQKLPFDGIAGR